MSYYIPPHGILKMAQGGAQNLTVNVNALSNAFAVALQQASTTGGTSTQSLTSNLQAPVPPSTSQSGGPQQSDSTR